MKQSMPADCSSPCTRRAAAKFRCHGQGDEALALHWGHQPDIGQAYHAGDAGALRL